MYLQAKVSERSAELVRTFEEKERCVCVHARMHACMYGDDHVLTLVSVPRLGISKPDWTVPYRSVPRQSSRQLLSRQVSSVYCSLICFEVVDTFIFDS